MAKKVEIENFNDGLVSFWALDEKRRPLLKLENIRFQQRVVGAKRNYLAEQAGHTVEMLIRIPTVDHKVSGLYAVIRGEQYKVTQAQKLLDTVPRCTQLTLSQPDLLLNFDQEEVGSGGRY